MHFLELINSSQALTFMLLRAILIFLFSIFILRFGNRRFHLNSAFDYLLVIILGGLLSRGINGSASLISTLLAATSLVFLHRFISIITFYFKSAEYMFKGRTRLLIKDGEIVEKALKKYHLSELDIMAQMRTQLHMEEISRIERAYLESTGNISFVCKK